MSKRVFLALLLGVVLFAAPFAVVRADDGEDDGVDEKDVVVLGDKNFSSIIDKAKFALVEFYAPWCGHCKTLKPEYAKAATALKASDPDVIIAKVDATEEKEVAEKFKVQGFPTLKWFVNGKEQEYEGGRTADDIIRYVKKKTGPPSVEISTKDALETVKKDNPVLVLGFFDKFDGADHEAFQAAALESSDAAFFKTTDKDVAAVLGIKKSPGFAVGRSHEGFEFTAIVADGHDTFSGKASTEEKLKEFVKAEKLPPFIEFSQDAAQLIFGSGIPYHMIVAAPEASFKPGSALFKDLLEVSSKLRGKAIIVTGATDNTEKSKPVLDFFGIDLKKKEPQIVGFHASDGKKYIYEGTKTTAAAILDFGKLLVEGKAKKFFKSAAEPAEPTEGGVTIVTGNNFDKIVKDAKKDVLLEIYAPWCGHCKSLAPIYEKLAKRFADVDSVVIAKMDGTENEHPDVTVQGYPTILFFPAAKDAASISHDGERTLAGLTKFIQEKAKVEFTLAEIKEEEEEEEETEGGSEEEEAEEEALEDEEVEFVDDDDEGDDDDDEDAHDEL